jgi:CRP/FNR family transcriptional regulator, anaerobic regulatory protein
MDVRVAALINQLGSSTNPILMTHQEIADELGSSREVISRILEGFAASGWIRPARGTLEVLDFPALDEISSL